MDSAAEDILLQKVEELVLDEDQVITNSVLCVKLNICLTEAKLLLQKYVSDHLSSGKISVTYLVCGKLKTGDYGIQIIEAKLLKEKSKIFSNIRSEVVYSIQKSNSIDLNLIAAIDNAGNEASNTTALRGSIVSEKCRECILKTKVLPPLPPQKNFEKQKPASFFKPIPKTKLTGDAEKTKSEQASVNNNAKIQNQKKLGSLATFFSQSSQNGIQNKNSEGEDENSKESKNDIVEIQPNTKLEELKQEINENSDEENLNSKKNGDTNLQKRNELRVRDKPVSKVPKKEKKDDGKKRKRIIMDSDSDDDLFGNNEDERMVLEESDEEKPVVKQVPLVPVPKNKKRKAVEKTYEDEEGFIVTKTEYVLVSAPEDEEEKSESQKKPEISKVIKTELREEKKLSSVAKPASKKKGKALAANQSSIMNFFKKK